MEGRLREQKVEDNEGEDINRGGKREVLCTNWNMTWLFWFTVASLEYSTYKGQLNVSS